MPSSDHNDSIKKKNIIKGRSYEKLAGLFFEQNGYEIIEKNWRAGRKEIDLIVKKDNELIFVEVKSASTKKYGHPAERVDAKKIANLTFVANQYIIAKNIQNLDLRFDVVTFLDGQLEHYPNAFEASS
jgi:putative endonuclease